MMESVMKRAFLLCLVIGLVISASANAQFRDYTGKSWASGNLGYAFGMGDAFASYSDPYTNTELSSDAGIGFGGQFYYGLKHNWLIGGELLFQSYTVKLTSPPNLALGFPGMDVSETQTETNVLVNSMYNVTQTRSSDLFLIGGTGLYDFGGMKAGLNTGMLWRMQVSKNVHLFGMPRLHMVFTDSTPMMIQLTMGAQFSLGG
jgi:hypothetical protein